jgi:hypothetical protein
VGYGRYIIFDVVNIINKGYFRGILHKNDYIDTICKRIMCEYHSCRLCKYIYDQKTCGCYDYKKTPGFCKKCELELIDEIKSLPVGAVYEIGSFKLRH